MTIGGWPRHSRAMADRLLRPEWGLRFLLLSLAAGLGVFTADLALRMAAPNALGWQARPLVVGTLPPGRMPQAGSTLSTFDPFHRAETAESGQTAQSAPETTLDLKLTGVRAPAAGDGSGSAIIRTPDHAQRAYRPGDEVLSGVRLVGVQPGAVVLARGEGREMLYLDERAREKESPMAVEAPAEMASIPDIDGIRLAPRFRDGRMTGIRILADGTAIFLKRNGLISGDVLLAVNGIEITSPALLEAALKALESADKADVVIERDGEERSLTLALDG